MADEPFTDYERGVLGLRSKSGLPTAEYQLGSQGKRDPATGQKKDPNNPSGGGGEGLVLLFAIPVAIAAAVSGGIGLLKFNFLHNRFLKKEFKENKKSIFAWKDKKIITHVINSTAPAAGVLSGSTLNQVTSTPYSIAAAVSVSTALTCISLLNHDRTEKQLNARRIKTIFALAVGITAACSLTNTKYGSWKIPNYYVSTNEVIVYRGPGQHYPLANETPLSHGTCIYRLNSRDGWIRIQFPESGNQDFYIRDLPRSLHVKRDRECSPTQLEFGKNADLSPNKRNPRRGSANSNNTSTPTQASYTHYVTANSLNVRSGTSSAFGIASDPLSNGECINVLYTTNNGWARIDLGNEGLGFVHGDYIKPHTSGHRCPN